MNVLNRARTFAQVQQRIFIIDFLPKANPAKLAVLVYSTIDKINAFIRRDFLQTFLIVFTSFEMLRILHYRLPQIYIIIDIYFRESADILLELLPLMKTSTDFLHLKFNPSQAQPRPLPDLYTLIHSQTSPKPIPRSIQPPQVYLTSQQSLFAGNFILAIDEPAAL